MSDDGKKLSTALDDPLSASRDPNNKKEWVKFEEESDGIEAKATAKVSRTYSPDDSWKIHKNSRSI